MEAALKGHVLPCGARVRASTLARFLSSPSIIPDPMTTDSWLVFFIVATAVIFCILLYNQR
jgi:hypothetical protein